jgi:tight adherence protein B
VILLILVLTLAAGVAFALGVRDLAAVAGSRRRALVAVLGDEVYSAPLVERLDRRFRPTPIGRRLERELVLAGVRHRPVVVFAAAVATAVLVSVTLWTLLAPLFGVLGVTAGYFAVRAYLRRERARRREAFVAQMPELARVLANATHAGLAIPTALALAADELEEPASSELRRVSTRLSFGRDLEGALDELTQRVASREVAVLTSTIAVSARSGGSLVTALRDIADTLEQRKETRREIRTTLAQSLATGYIVLIVGFAILLLLNAMFPGVVERMTASPAGQIALVVSGALFTGGFLAIRRMTRIEP